LKTTSIIGFDSAWTDKPTAPGAICTIRLQHGGAAVFYEPQMASFARALEIIAVEREHSDLCLVALDQPTIVPNLTSLRPVDRVAASLVSWIGGGVQPANRSKKGMFDDEAPIWRFLSALGAIEDPELARVAPSGLFVMEVFPALALPMMNALFCGRLAGPRYNPERRKTFQRDHWRAVAHFLGSFGDVGQVHSLATWLTTCADVLAPRKADQDKLDAVICALVGWHWLKAPREMSVMIGDLGSGYMVSPAPHGAHPRLVEMARANGVPINGALL
jgi:predicted RNase H-like nuclease